MPGGWAPGAIVKRSNAPNGMEVGIDFPFVCEVCLGPNPYVRMVKGKPGDKLCKISGRPFTSFRWRAGPGGRWKECMVEASVAKDKNICQACLVDMTYGVPVGVRDALLAAGADSDSLAVATSDPNSSFYWQQKDALAANNPNGNGSLQNLEPSRQLLHMARSIQSQEHKQTTAWRNLPKLCSFWLAGTCSRVVQHKCPFRPCNGTFEFPELAATHRELRTALIERLKKEGAVTVMRDLDPDTKEALHNAGKGNKEEAIKKRYDGSDDLTKRYLRRAREEMPNLVAPKDLNIMSLWVGGVEAPIEEQDLKDAFYAFGEVRSIKMLTDRKCAFVEFTTRQAAEAAAEKLHRALVVKGLKLDLDWAKPSVAKAPVDPAQGGVLLPPPGIKGNAPVPQLPIAMQQRLAASVSNNNYVPTPPPGAPPPPPAPPAGEPPSAKRSRLQGPPPPPPRAPKYPSMDPTRLGAKGN
jgi:pre-mRNA-splicing factor RBM22/SLT11